ncbi:RNA polymerase sigma factor [Paenarthrobacter sp. NPDC056912]|uniref:RNA polymerase sigma factor n=1 Tax=Paenarthrobacter sp. NPDC056912 TaxID=3345965 RepID=UPI00366ED9B7
MRHSSHPPDRRHSFGLLYEAVYPDLHKFVQRRAHPDHADDIVADAFLVVWRRFDEAPGKLDDARAWIFGITRNILLNTNRGEQRRLALGVRLAEAVAAQDPGEDADLITRRVDLARAWRLLSDVHQEALGLAVFEDLNATQAAVVLGISPVAFRLRLSRARRALRLLLEHVPPPLGTPASDLVRTTTP